MQNLPFSPPSYTEEEVEAVADCVRAQWTGTGPKTNRFETEFKEYKGVGSAAALSSCTSALYLALKSLGIGPGDEVITTAMTFCSTINVILHCGATPVLCDIDKRNKNIDANLIERLITSKTKAIIPVHYAGYPCEMDKIMQLSKAYQLYIVEDCAHAIETKYKSQHCGTFGEIGCFSFYATKNIAIGEGGMAISNNESLIKEISLLRLHGLSKDAWRRFERSSRSQYDVKVPGHKMNMTDIQSAIGLCQLKRINEMYKRRVEIWDFYNTSLQSLDLSLPALPEDTGSVHARHLYAIGLPTHIDRDEFVWKASKDYGVTLGVHYQAIQRFSAYKYIFKSQSDNSLCPNAQEWGKRTVSLSLSAAVSTEDATRVVECITDLLKAYQ